MVRSALPAALLFSAAGLSLLAAPPTAPTAMDRFWPQWRGPLATGEAPLANPPLEWSEEKNVRWKVEVPGRGQSSPVVWNDLVFVTTAVPVGKAAPAKSADRRPSPRLPQPPPRPAQSPEARLPPELVPAAGRRWSSPTATSSS